MGKAVIYEHLGDGKYSVMYTPEVAAVDAEIEKLEDLKTALDVQLYDGNGLINAKDAAQAVYDSATGDFYTTLDDWAACAMMLPPCPQQAALMAAVQSRGTARAEAGAALTIIKLAISQNRSEYFATTQQIAYLQNTKKGSGSGLMEVWCIDYDAATPIPVSTVVGTVETYGAKGGYAGGFLPRKWVNIQTSKSPTYLAARDHCVKPLSGIKTAAMFFNWCQWLYVMSRNPQYSVGVVQSKFDPHQTYLDVYLYGTTPGAAQPGGYPYIPGESDIKLLNVSVNYLTCGAEAFLAGDHVIVRFGGINRSDPQVIGFAQNPRECQPACHQDWPYHGVVRNGYMTLPNGTARLVAQPGTTGDVVTIQIPDHTAPTRTEAEEAADLVAGMTWQDYKTFAGPPRRYNETCNLGTVQHWVWAPSSASHWLVELSTGYIETVSGVTTATIHIELSEPLLLTVAEPATTTHLITLTPTLTGTWIDSFDLGSQLSALTVIDVSSDGSKVILAAQRRSQNIREGQRGFFLLELTSTSTVTLTVLADHVECNPTAYDTDHPFDGTYSEFIYEQIPIWAWFNSADVVKFVYFYMRQYSGPAGETLHITLSVDDVVESDYTANTIYPAPYTYAATLEGDSPTLLSTGAQGSAWGTNEAKTAIIYVGDQQFNAHRWISFCHGYYGSEGARIVIEPIVYSNKSIGLRVQMLSVAVVLGEYIYTLTDTYYGNVIHPPGPTDPGTWISDDGAAPFTLLSPPAGVVHAEPSADYSSYHLQTGQLIRNQTVPVCYL